MSEQPRSSDPSERPETLVERLKALSAKWRDAVVWEYDDMGKTESGYTLEKCADELDAVLWSWRRAVLSSLTSRAVPSTGEATYPKLNQAGRLAWEDGYAAGKRDAAAPSDSLAPAAFPMDGVWRCEDCGEAGPQLDARWRWAGDRWQHHHEYPVGHIDARYFGPAPADSPTCGNGLCACGHLSNDHACDHLSNDHACDHEASDRSCFKCECEAFRRPPADWWCCNADYPNHAAGCRNATPAAGAQE